MTLTTAGGDYLDAGTTDADGRVRPIGAELAAGDYVLSFATGSYHRTTGQESFYPSVAVAFTVGSAEHYHVPLLLSPFGYSTYRGS